MIDSHLFFSFFFFFFVVIFLLQVDGDTSTNDTVIALASGLSGLSCVSSLNSDEATQLQACLDAVSLTTVHFLLICYQILLSFPVDQNDIRIIFNFVGSMTVLVKLEHV